MDVFEDYSKAPLQRVVNLTDVNVSLLSVMVTPVLYNDEIRILYSTHSHSPITSIYTQVLYSILVESFSVGKPDFTVQ